MTDLKPCPCCGGYARISFGKQIQIMLQSWHDPDEAIEMPATIRCTECGLTVSAMANKAEHGGANQASLAAKNKAIEKWNKRTEESNG